MVPVIPVIIAAVVGAVVGGTVVSAFMEKIKTTSVKEGYEKASEVYEEKYKKTYDDFESHRKSYKKNQEEYEDLIKSLKEYIEFLRKQHEDLKKQGTASVYAGAAVNTGTSLVIYTEGLRTKIEYYEKRLEQLEKLKEEA